MKISLFVLVAFCLMACTNKSVNNLCTSEALTKYSTQFGNQSFLVFPELRENPIKWFDSIPEGKIIDARHPEDFVMAACPDEYYVFQLGVWALKQDISDLQIEFSDLKSRNGKTIPSTSMTCLNKGGTDFRGNSFLKEVRIPSGRVQALWMGINLDGIEKGNYSGSVSVIASGEKRIIPLLLKVSGEAVPDHGYNEGSRLSRLNWLNSTLGFDDEVTKGYTPVKVEGNSISILGRTLTLAENGLPASVISYFGPSNQSLVDKGEPVVSNPFRFIIELANGKIVRLIPGDLKFTESKPSRVSWNALNTSDEFDLECMGTMEFDGFADYRLKLTAKVPAKIKDIRLEIPVAENKAQYMMGLGHEGGFRTPDWKWKWDLSKNQDMLWVGAVNGGLRVKWKAENYVHPLINIYYAFGPLKLPPSWGNEFKGGVNVVQKNRDVVISAYSGDREMRPGDRLNYNFELLITPFRTINRQNKFGDRYYHGGGTKTSGKIEKAKEAGANIINIHHAEDIYPFINYPYLDANVAELAQLVANAHKENMRMKFYYTTRELTKNLPEFWAFNSLNGEIIFPGPGNSSRTEALHPKGPDEWLIKNLRENYIPAWYNLIKEGKFKGETDLSVITTPDSRLNNFYVAGLDWMVRNIGIDGVYIDDSALDRYTIQRARKVIDRYRPEGRMDLHSWNHFNKWAGFANCLNMYMDLLPYFDLVWIGEGRDYNRAPDHWLIEVSGIPFGLAGQMLPDGENQIHPWRGMVYGITNRTGWTGNTPSEIWKFWDEHKIADKIMTGYWEDNCPVTCGNRAIKASIFKGTDEVIISVANWTDNDQDCSLVVNWKKLGIDPGKVDISIPEVKDFQTGQNAVSLNKISIPGKKGYMILLKMKS
ncbi:MAG: DUF6067 family protein [Bacteroidales bacterium]|nr:DUF6067 family protein [Bacteroidales bacterium]